MKLNTKVLPCLVLLIGVMGGAAPTMAQEPGPSEQRFTVRVQTGGLVALVPDASGDALAILMVDARRRATAGNGCLVPAHDPQLVWKAGSCSCTGCGSKDPCPDHSLVLKLEDVRINADGAGAASAPPLDLGGLADPSSRPRAEAPQPLTTGQAAPASLGPEWSLHFGEILPTGNSTEVEAGCFAALPGVDCPVVARLALDRGTVRTCRLGELQVDDPTTKKPTLETYTFGISPLTAGADAPEFRPRTLPEVLEVSWEQSGSGIDVALIPFEAPKGARHLSLTPTDGGEIVLDFLNLPAEEIETTQDCDPRQVDYHFEHLYRLAAEEPATVVVPVTREKVTGVQPACGLVKLEVPPPGGSHGNGWGSLPPHVSACIPGVYGAHEDVDRLLSIGTEE